MFLPSTSGHQRNTGGDAVSNPRRSRRTQGLPPVRSFSASPTRRIDPEDAASWNNNVFFCQPPPPSLEFFGGYSEEDPAEWLEELELLARQQRWPEDVMLAYARSYLKGPAKKWVKLNTSQIFSNWTTFKKTLMQDFKIADTTKFKLIMELQNRVQGYNESTLRYAEDVLNLCNKVNSKMSAEDKLYYMKTGLNKYLSLVVLMTPCSTVKEFLELARRIDQHLVDFEQRRSCRQRSNPIQPFQTRKYNYNNYRGSARPSNEKPQISNERPTDYGRQNIIPSKFEGKRIIETRAGTSGVNLRNSPPPQQNRNNEQRSTRPNTYYRRQYQVDKRICWNCSEQGHISRNHHTLLHVISSPPRQRESFSVQFTSPKSVQPSNVPSTSTSCCLSGADGSIQILLSTAIIHIQDVNGEDQICRALLDNGSQRSLITEKCAAKLGIPIRRKRIAVGGLGDQLVESSLGEVLIRFSSHFDYQSFETTALVLTKLTNNIPSFTVKKINYSHMKGLILADPSYFKSREIDVILGSDIVFNLIQEERRNGKENEPSAIHSKLGWLVYGPTSVSERQSFRNMAHFSSELESEDLIKRFWELESIPLEEIPTKEEKDCESHYLKNVVRDESGRYIVRLPFKESAEKLGKSKSIAISRFLNLEKRLEQNEKIYVQYKQFMNEYIRLGHMQASCSLQTEPKYYIPHHCILKAQPTKLRVVFDASTKTTTQISLNDLLHVGPKLQNNIFSILLKFRTNSVALVADIEKMYRQIRLHPDDIIYQTILWRDCKDLELQEYNLLTVTYGLACAPYLAIRTLHQIAHEVQVSNPRVSKIIREDFYVDDLLTGCPTVEDAKGGTRATIDCCIGFWWIRPEKMDSQGILRVGGRLRHSDLDMDQKHPMLIPKDHFVTKLIVMHYHVNNLHSGTQLTLSLIRNKFWIPSGRNLIKRVLNQCLVCLKSKSKAIHQIMGDLPKNRLLPGRPFEKIGIDLAGPIQAKPMLKRSKVIFKFYIVLFVCFTTKAIHLEVSSDLTAETFLAALKRFISRRGRPTDIYSDNATNFKGASNILKERWKLFNAANIQDFSAIESINWHFIPPSAPNFGGLWEAGIKSVKTILSKTMKSRLLNYEELLTLLAQIEACLNSRPLTFVSNDPNDLTALTPGHFLIGNAMRHDAESDHSTLNLRSRWNLIQPQRDFFWNRWSCEYLHQLQERRKWRTSHPDVNIGDLVMLKEQNKPLQWKLARIVQIFPGEDDHVRVVLLRTPKGLLNRPITKICPLPYKELIFDSPMRIMSSAYIKRWTVPKLGRTVKDVRAFLGLCSYYRIFIREFSKVALPLQILTRKNHSFAWGKEQELSFNSLKNKLISPEVLTHYDPNKPIGLHTDASDQGLGAVLVHLNENTKERPISYASRTLQKAETNYSTTEKECLAIIWAIKKFRPYLYGRKFTIYTDHHSLCWMAKMKNPAGRLARWSLELQEYDFAIKYKSGKTHLDADGLSRCPIPERIISTINYEEHDYDSYIKKIDNLVNQNPNSYGENFTKFKKKLFKKNPSVTGDPWLLIVPKNKQKELLENMHDHPTSGHMGIKRTYNRLKSKYFWPSMLKTVEEYVSSCPECQFRKTPSQLPQGLLQPIPPASRPFEKMGIDLMGRFPESGRGNSWILVCTDYYSRYIETAALPRGTAEEIADFFLQKVVLRHGAPKTVISDWGSCFLSKLFKEVLKICNTLHKKTTSYHPQTNGQTERMNRTLADMMAMYIDERHQNWDEILPFVTFAYNSSIQDTTGYSPYFLIHGREPLTFLDSTFDMPELSKHKDYDEYVSNLLEIIEDAKEISTSKTIARQNKSKQLYDRTHREVKYAINDLVLIWTPIRKVGRADKLQRRYIGPYQILRQTSPVNYEVIEIAEGKRKKRQIVHVTRMKPYRSPDLRTSLFQEGERSRRLQRLEPEENIAMINQETQTKMSEYHFQPFRNPSIFTGERNQNPEKWLKEFHRVARYNCWDDSMCLANVYFFLQGTAHRWYENVEEKINSWDIFVKMFSQNFGHHVTQKDQLAEKLKTRAQGKEETSDSYIQDVLHLCREVDPAMMENEIIAHLTKGISEEIYRSMIILDIATIDEFIKWCRKIEASNKKRVNKRVVFDRLPNVAAIGSADSESMEDLVRRIVREEVHRALNPESTTPEPSSLKEIIREEIKKNVAAISKPIQRPPPRQSYPNQTRTFNQVPRHQYPTQTPIYNQTPPQRRTDEWRTHDNIPICFNCGRPGHVKRYCRERRQWTQRPEGHAPSTQEPQIVDSGSSFSVISDGLRRQLKKTMFKDSGMALKVADGKNVTSIGRCTISLSINGLERPLEFIVLPNSNPSIILGWDFLEASNTVIDCGRAEIRLEEAKDVLNSPASMGKVVASRSVVIPAESAKLINVMSEELNGQNQRHDKIFDKNNEPVKQTSVTKHKIETGNHQPIKHRPYRVSPTERQAIQTEVDKMLDAGIIRHSESPWSSPVILVKKKDGNWRFCVDYRRLNKVTKKDVYPLPRIDDTLDSLKGAKFYSSMDLRSGYWQIEVDEADREKTAFITPDGLYEFLVMPFGLCNAPATFERMMDKILKGLKWTMALCYLDDIVVYSKSFNEHLHRLEIMLQCLDKAELRLNPKKCLFGTKRIRVFGHLVDSKGLLRDIRKYVAHCKECQRKKQSTQKPPGLLKAIPPATSPFQRVGMDLLGRFPKSDTGNKWIIVCTDYLTRFAVTKALPTGEAKEAAKFLMEDVVLKHGAPREIITDRGRVFQSKLIAELTNQCSSIHRFTTAYHPQTNGLTERLNKTLANMIAMYVSVEQKDWDVILPYVTFAYNTAKQDTTGFTPFELIHGREAETTVDTLFPNPHEDLQEDYSQRIASRVEETRQLARLETLKAQEKDKARYDSKHEAMDYDVGDLVWIFIPIRKVGLSEKLMKRYFGPYRVTRKLSDVTFEVEPVDQPTRRRQTRDLVHVLRMKPYHDPEDQADLF
ncbi:hypothetical protein LAZ67_3000767, partial [Cordylochernes scorpioides]